MATEYGCMDCGWRGEHPPERTELIHRGPGSGQFTAKYCPQCWASVLAADLIDWSQVIIEGPDEPL